MFQVGQKVVCVDNSQSYGGWGPDDDVPIVGLIYTIHSIFTVLGRTAFELHEIRRGAKVREQWDGNVGYGAFRFRPIIARQTDIAIFTEMLNPQNIREDVG